MKENEYSSTQGLLTIDEQKALVESNRLNIGSYRTWVPVRDCELVVDLDALPLAVLADGAACGSRVYELMSIRRPGDVLHYLWIRFVTVDYEVVEYVKARMGDKDRLYFDPATPLDGLPFPDFDGCFAWRGDDTRPFEAEWRRHRESGYWEEKLNILFALVSKMQARLRNRNDFLLRHEIRLIDERKHRRDYLATVHRKATLKTEVSSQTELPHELFHLIGTLIKQHDVQSVSCPLGDFALWRSLVAEQVRRSQQLGVHPQRALGLSGPDSGLRHLMAEDWGGEVHFPYEGVCEGDLFIMPEWQIFRPESAGANGRLSWAVGKSCHYLLTHKDYGELGCATRKAFGEWTLYQSKWPYSPCNPFSDSS